VTGTAPLLLDTCAVIWFADNAKLAETATSALNGAIESGDLVYLSPITAWEIGILCARGRMRFPMAPQAWFDRVQHMEGIELAPLPPSVLIASSFLPGRPPNDPADRIFAATAREFGYRLMTRDRPLLEYGEQGYLQVIAC
jgi:PIN domain nuclease of toxin-antitoxin system